LSQNNNNNNNDNSNRQTETDQNSNNNNNNPFFDFAEAFEVPQQLQKIGVRRMGRDKQKFYILYELEVTSGPSDYAILVFEIKELLLDTVEGLQKKASKHPSLKF
jgi:hypothetical protein